MDSVGQYSSFSDMREASEDGSNTTADDDSTFYPKDDNYKFFAKGRDFESTYVNHQYTQSELKTLGSFESLDYLPSHSEVYKEWLTQQPPRLDWDRWLVMGVIGLMVGFIGFLMHQVIDLIAMFKWDLAQKFIQEGSLFRAWVFISGYSLIFILLSAGLVVFFRPSAGGSGIPEVIGFLNGTMVRHIFNIKTFVIKFLSCCFAVGSGMPVGPEGPMIHLGSLVGAGVSQFKSKTLKFTVPVFERLRNSEDRRNFISAGAAAGVASAFGAPVGGLLFSMEEVSSFWNMKLSWQIFFCAMISTFTTDLFNSAFTGFRYQGQFGMFKADKYILFQVHTGIAVNILVFIPAVLLGAFGGAFGALFTFINLKIARARKRLLARVNSPAVQKVLRVAEPTIIMLVTASVSVYLPQVFHCSTYKCVDSSNDIRPNCKSSSYSALHTSSEVVQYTCPAGIDVEGENYTFTNNSYNQLATMFFGTGEDAIQQLFTRNTHLQFSYSSLCTALPLYFLLACWAAGTSISSGIVVPMLFIGGLYGRILGVGMVDLFGLHTDPDSYWAWMDPGAFALIGAASFFGGVSRLTMSLTVIMLEITNDVQFLLPMMATIMVAKWVGDFLTHPLYHAILELKCIPFLDTEPIILDGKKNLVNLELFKAKDVATQKVKVIPEQCCVSDLAALLLDKTHNHQGFPVVRSESQLSDEETFCGFIHRDELLILLQHDDLFYTRDDIVTTQSDDIIRLCPLSYTTLQSIGQHSHNALEANLYIYTMDPKFKTSFVNLNPYINQSAVCVRDNFSLHRTYIIFRTLGLRHLTVVDSKNHVAGILTRKDLMGFFIERKLQDKISSRLIARQSNVELLQTINQEPEI